MQTNTNSLQNLKGVNFHKKACSYCDRMVTLPNHKKHEKCCKNNPSNLIECPVCSKKFSPRYKETVTCSHACANTYFRTGLNNPRNKNATYRTICFHHHGKKCLVCGENKIVSVHHINEDHKDNRPENLVPLCPTHHQYVHSKYKHLVEPLINSYMEKYQGVG